MISAARREALLSQPVADDHYGVILDTNDAIYWYFSARLVTHNADEPEYSWTEIVPSDKDAARIVVTEEEVRMLWDAERYRQYMIDKWYTYKMTGKPRMNICITAES